MCTAIDGEPFEMKGSIVCGNIDMILGTGDTGEPFIIVIHPNNQLNDYGCITMIIPLDGMEISSSVLNIYGDMLVPTELFDTNYYRNCLYIDFRLGDDNGLLSSSHTYNEVLNAIGQQQYVVGRFNGDYYHILSTHDQVMIFKNVDYELAGAEGTIQIFIKEIYFSDNLCRYTFTNRSL